MGYHRVVLTVEALNASPPRRRPTRRQLEVLRAYIRVGSVAAAAHELRIQRDDGAPAPVRAVSADGVPERSAGGVSTWARPVGWVSPISKTAPA